jgi:glycosyltransferase involved in cell wall biosynthesis
MENRNISKQIQVVSVGPDVRVQGGVSRVIELISSRIPAHVRFRHVPTFTSYTGADGLDAAQRGSRLRQGLVFARAFARVLKAAVRRQTIFHVHFAVRGSLIRKGLLCAGLRTLRCTYVVHSHVGETNMFYPWVPQLCRRLILWGIGGADRFIVLTQFWRDYFASLLRLPPNRLLLLPNPANIPECVPDRLHRRGLRLLFLGRMSEMKGAFDSIRAFAQLPDEVRSHCSLTLAGDGEVDAVASLAAQSGCSERVSIRAWVGPKEVEALLRDSDLFLLPSYAEGMSMALIEAMSWALAVVTTDVGGAQAFLKHGNNGILLAPGDVTGISGAICELYHDPQKRVDLGTAARKTMRQFAIEGYMAKLSALYEELAGLQGREQAAPSSVASHARRFSPSPAKTQAVVKLD